MVGMVYVKLAHEGENNIIGVEITGGSKVFGCMKFYAFTEMKGILCPIGGNIPCFSETRSNLSCASFEFDKFVENLAGRGIKGCPAV